MSARGTDDRNDERPAGELIHCHATLEPPSLGEAQPGEGISGQRTMPIGQVFFVPREEITLRDCTEDELAAMKRADEEFSRGKAADQVTTPYGIPYSPHYLKESRARQKGSKEPSS